MAKDIAQFHTDEEAKHDFPWCVEAVESGQRSAVEQYENAVFPSYFMWTLCGLNRAKGDEIVRALMQRLIDATDGMVDISSEDDFCDWYDANKTPEVGTLNVALGRGCHFVRGHNDGKVDMPNALAPNQFILVWISAWNDATGAPEAQVSDDLKQWLRDNVTLEEFTNFGEWE